MKLNKLFLVGFFLFFFSSSSARAALDISISSSPVSASKYGKLEVSFTIPGINYTTINPFNPNLSGTGGTSPYQKPGINVLVTFKRPSGTFVVHPAFYDGNGIWKFRLSPKEAGTWQYQISAEIAGNNGASAVQNFSVTDSANPGFVRINASDRRFFQYENGKAFNPVGVALSALSGGTTALIDGSNGFPPVFDEMAKNGMNFTRLFWNTVNIEPHGTGSESDATLCSRLNNYNLSFAQSLDRVFERASQVGVHIQFLMDDWEKIKTQSPNKNVYAACGGQLAAGIEDMFTLAAVKEVYKRKLRYVLARYGAYTGLMSIEFINELGGGGLNSNSWHIEMADYVHNAFPYLGRLATSSYGSDELRANTNNWSIPFDKPAMDYANYHSYARQSFGWSVSKTNYGGYSAMEKLGSPLVYPWLDTAVMIERIFRAEKIFGWNKPLTYTEFGLIDRSTGSWPDWDSAYKIDTEGKHVRHAIWPAALYGGVLTHWKNDYIRGYGIYSPGGSKFWLYYSLSAFLKDADFTGMTQETTYASADSRNSNPKILSSNPQVMVMGMRGTNKAYLYVKNMTNMWTQLNPPALPADANIPQQSDQSAIIQVAGLLSGTYSLEQFNTKAKDSTTLKTMAVFNVASDGVARISVSNLSDDVAFRLTLTTGPTPTPTPIPLPLAPSLLSASAISSTQINLSWSDNSSNESDFKIERSGNSAGPFVQFATVSANTISFSNAALIPVTAYFYRIRAYNISGDSAYSNTASAVTLGIVPAAPSNLQATTLSTSQIRLTWTDQATNETGYRIDRATAAVGPFTSIANLAANAVSFDVSGLSANTVYYFRVVAFNAIGNSPEIFASAQTLAPPTPTPTPTPLPVNTLVLAGVNPVKGETEVATLSGNMISASDALASGGKFIHIPDGKGNGSGNAEFKLDASHAPGIYILFARVYFLDTAANSFSVSLNSGTPAVLGNDSTYGAWRWIRLSSTLNLNAAIHTLTISGREDGSRLDQIILTTNTAFDPSQSSFGIPLSKTSAAYFEAESGTVSGLMIAASDSTVSGGKYIHVPDTAGNNSGAVEYSVNATNASATYYLYARVFFLDTSANSFSVQLDGATALVLGNDFVYGTWRWIQLGSGLVLSSGLHQLSVGAREDGARLDRLVLTTDAAFQPK